jgi:hypothetical protein
MNAGEVIALVSVSLVFVFGVLGLLLRAVNVLVAIRVELAKLGGELSHVSRRVDRIERLVESESEGSE